MEGQGSFGSWKEDRGAGKPGRGAEAVWVRSLGEKLEKDAVCSAHLLPAGLGLTPAHSLALVSPGSLVTWSTLAGNPALWVDRPSWERRSRRSKASFRPGHPGPWMEISPPQEAADLPPAVFGGSLPLTVGVEVGEG